MDAGDAVIRARKGVSRLLKELIECCSPFTCGDASKRADEAAQGLVLAAERIYVRHDVAALDKLLITIKGLGA